MVGAWLNGRENWQDYDARRREIIRAAEASLTPEFDNEFLTLLERGEAHRITDFTSEELEKAAGNGAQELRTWLLMAAALGHAPARRLAYEPMPEWLTGMGVAVIDPVDADPAQLKHEGAYRRGDVGSALPRRTSAPRLLVLRAPSGAGIRPLRTRPPRRPVPTP